eukprot:541112_1
MVAEHRQFLAECIIQSIYLRVFASVRVMPSCQTLDSYFMGLITLMFFCHDNTHAYDKPLLHYILWMINDPISSTINCMHFLLISDPRLSYNNYIPITDT